MGTYGAGAGVGDDTFATAPVGAAGAAGSPVTGWWGMLTCAFLPRIAYSIVSGGTSLLVQECPPLIKCVGVAVSGGEIVGGFFADLAFANKASEVSFVGDRFVLSVFIGQSKTVILLVPGADRCG